MAKSPFSTVNEYIDSFDENVIEKLQSIRSLVLESVPDASEKLSWGAPTYAYHGFLIQFAAYQHHIGFYTSPQTIQQFKEQLSDYKTNEKNTVQFPLGKPLPLTLMRDMIVYQATINKE